jgi:hypothetical protein
MGDNDGLGVKEPWDAKPFRYIELEGTPCICLVSEDAQAFRHRNSRWPWMNQHQSLSTEFDEVLQLSRVPDSLIHRSTSL